MRQTSHSLEHWNKHQSSYSNSENKLSSWSHLFRCLNTRWILSLPINFTSEGNESLWDSQRKSRRYKQTLHCLQCGHSTMNLSVKDNKSDGISFNEVVRTPLHSFMVWPSAPFAPVCLLYSTMLLDIIITVIAICRPQLHIVTCIIISSCHVHPTSLSIM